MSKQVISDGNKQRGQDDWFPCYRRDFIQIFRILHDNEYFLLLQPALPASCILFQIPTSLWCSSYRWIHSNSMTSLSGLIAPPGHAPKCA
ncbi:hypothetical protein JRO89_XS07G0227200 [Xanthoceras sorbifolium]|uniref:Uncharacterized protein n=1 Tax=Xanthoceras sorbifolium TaxID=99658 RepID=A0ABQ8HUN1_9ROSI|nr:hypothetical protein JRO89_XS07G0227200 [Xanthoceras sorbifolium]